MALTPGTRLGAYEIGAALGAGGIGEVYRAVHLALSRENNDAVENSSLSPTKAASLRITNLLAS